MAEYGLTYDSSWPKVTYLNPGLWPYTLDYAGEQDCVVPLCPTASIPGVWLLPMNSWLDLQGSPCSKVDGCYWVLDLHDDADAWLNFIVTNFERHYFGNRSPFGVYLTESYINAYPAIQQAVVRFMELISSLNDAFMVNSGDVIDWVKDPVPVNEYRQKPCKTVTATTCPPTMCELEAAHNPWSNYWMQICNVCPRVYPWLGNPLGQ